MFIFIPLLALPLFLVSAPAHAQWTGFAEAGMRHARMTEVDSDGRRLVRERGWLPGIAVGTRYASAAWQVDLGAEIYRNEIDYDGRLQSGGRFTSEAGTTQSRVRVEIARHVAESTQLIAGFEHDHWGRNIQGQAGVAGLRERYSSNRLLAGARTRVLQTTHGNVGLKVLAVLAGPERMRVRFEQQLFDEARLKTKSALGVRLAAEMHIASVPGLTLEANAEWIEIDRSEDAALRRNGARAGTIAQPKHRRDAIGVAVRYQF